MRERGGDERKDNERGRRGEGREEIDNERGREERGAGSRGGRMR